MSAAAPFLAPRAESALVPPVVQSFGAGAVMAGRGYSAAHGGTLIASECDACGARAWPPLPRCHVCWSTAHDLPLSGDGTLYAYSVLHVGPAGWPTPYAIGYVDLPEGVRVFTHLRDWEGGLRLDSRVTLQPGEPGAKVPFTFGPASDQGAA